MAKGVLNVLKEFKEFALKGNVLDLAIAVVIGGAFGKIVSSLVNDIIMPIASVLTGGVNFSHLKLILKEGTGDTAITLNYGAFIQNIVDFLIISISIFIFIKLLNKFKREKKTDVPEEETPKESDEVLLLREIRDLLKAR
ncbi:MAG TPA: large-conductance mechanosensitive channel protein MscL [Firmicutes bacterium]|nr:large-conductance mechanosensitive channel protein MscL [Bacillota bacterium]